VQKIAPIRSSRHTKRRMLPLGRSRCVRIGKFTSYLKYDCSIRSIVFVPLVKRCVGLRGRTAARSYHRSRAVAAGSRGPQEETRSSFDSLVEGVEMVCLCPLLLNQGRTAVSSPRLQSMRHSRAAVSIFGVEKRSSAANVRKSSWGLQWLTYRRMAMHR